MYVWRLPANPCGLSFSQNHGLSSTQVGCIQRLGLHPWMRTSRIVHILESDVVSYGRTPAIFAKLTYTTSRCRLFTPEIATYYEEFLTSKGITFIKGDTASSFVGKDGKARRSGTPGCCRGRL